jgi:hypothetical protein
MMRCASLGTHLMSMLFCALAEPAFADRDNLAAIRHCMDEQADDARLKCFDNEIRKLVKPTFEGRLDVVTEPFTINGPTVLRFQSDGVIFVLYLKTIRDEVVQNLHIGGGGESTYLIEKPGTYFLQVNGAESWRIWLEPPPKIQPSKN